MATKNTNTLTRAQAKKVMWEYYRDNKSDLPKWISECREEILEGLMDGESVQAVFESTIETIELEAA
jgi:hypothetical protein